MDHLLCRILWLLVACAAFAVQLIGHPANASLNDIVSAGTSVSSGQLNAGQTQMVVTNMIPMKTLRNVRVNVAIQSVSGAVVAQQTWTNQSFSAHMTRSFQANLALPLSASGFYWVSVQAVDGSTGLPDLNSPNAVGFWVTAAPSSGSSSGTSAPSGPPAALKPANTSPLPPVSATPPPTALSAITGGGTTLQNIDGDFSKGGNLITTMKAPQSSPTGGVYSGSQQLWLLFPNTYGVSSGTGGLTMAYQSGAVTTAVDLAGIGNQVVSGYPEIVLGSDVFGYHNGDQGPQFPVQLSSMQSLYIDTQYSLKPDSSYTGNLDVLFDLWLEPYIGYKDGQIGSLEIEILPYFNFPPAGNYWGTYLKTIAMPVIVNGQQTSLYFLEYAAQNQGNGGGKGPGTTILFYPAGGKGLTSAAIKFDAVPFLREAAQSAQISEDWYLPGINFGTEFGGATRVKYNFEIDKLFLTQTLK